MRLKIDGLGAKVRDAKPTRANILDGLILVAREAVEEYELVIDANCNAVRVR